MLTRPVQSSIDPHNGALGDFTRSKGAHMTRAVGLCRVSGLVDEGNHPGKAGIVSGAILRHSILARCMRCRLQDLSNCIQLVHKGSNLLAGWYTSSFTLLSTLKSVNPLAW